MHRNAYFYDTLMARIDIDLLPNLKWDVLPFQKHLCKNRAYINIWDSDTCSSSQGESNWKHSFSLLNKDANVSFDDLVFVFTDGFFLQITEPDIVKDIPYKKMYIYA